MSLDYAANGLDLNDVPPLREYDDRDDEEVMHRLRERAPEWVPLLFPRGRRSIDGKEWRVANIHGAPPKKEGSCKINLDGDNAGDWYDFSLSKGGGPVSTIKETTGLSGAALMERMREYAGMPLRQPARTVAKRSDVDRSLDVAFILKMCAKPAETVVETYLRSRGLDLPPTEDIKFHSSLTDWNDRTAPIGRPAMVAIVRRPDTGEATGGVHRTYLAEDGSRKADVPKPKMMLGPCDGVVMLMAMGADGSLGVAEGLESSLAAHKLFGVPTWAALSTSGMRNFVFPPGLKRLAIFADRGADGEGTAFHLRERALARGIEATVTLPRSDDDFARDLELGLRPEAGREEVIPPPRTLNEIVVAAGTLTRPVDHKQLLHLMRNIALARPNTLDAGQMLAVIKRRTGIGVGDLRDLLKEARRETGNLGRVVSGRPPAWAGRVQLWENGEPKPILYNAVLALREDDAWRGVVGRNDFTDRIRLRRSPPWPTADWTEERDWTQDDLLKATEWVQAAGISAPLSTVCAAVESVANESRFHPVRDWLDILEWDGERRLDKWLPDYCGAAASHYTAAVGSRFLISAAARVYRPGCKVDCALILEGKQGIGKSGALRALFDPWFTDEIADLGTKDAAMQLAGVWCIELAELDALGRAEVHRIKAWISRTNDRYRPPYGHAVVDVPRQCVFAGSVNEDEYLRDPTGSRRFWPVHCGSRIDVPNLFRAREQLWAEALARYRGRENWWLEEANLVSDAAAEQADRETHDPWHELIDRYLQSAEKQPDIRTTGVSIPDILEHVIGKSKECWEHKDSIRVGACLKQCKWYKKQMRVGGKPERRYFPSASGGAAPDPELSC